DGAGAVSGHVYGATISGKTWQAYMSQAVKETKGNTGFPKPSSKYLKGGGSGGGGGSSTSGRSGGGGGGTGGGGNGGGGTGGGDGGGGDDGGDEAPGRGGN